MTIVITLPNFIDGEAVRIVQLLNSSVDLVHIRKPEAKAEEIEKLIRAIPCEYYARLVVHDHYELAEKYHLHGVHLNSRNAEPPANWQGSVSKSCHTMEEVAEWKNRCDYVSLSPIFDSISKQGYHAAFSSTQIEEARAMGIIDDKVMALGGVTFNRIDDVLRMGFGGGMILGDAWKDVLHPQQPTAMTIAGSDSSAGAGIQQDLKTMSAAGVYCATVITAITSQNTLGVKSVMPISADVVRSQIEAVLADLHITSIKIGMIPNAAVAHTIADCIMEYKKQHHCDIVYDPVMISTSGHRLMEEDCIQVVCQELIPICSLVTPNIPETECLLNNSKHPHGEESSLPQIYGTNFLVKGGHSDEDNMDDTLYLTTGQKQSYATKRIDSHNLHGTGCTLSSAIAANMLKGYDLAAAIGKAKQLLTQGIKNGAAAHIGKGNGPLLFH